MKKVQKKLLSLLLAAVMMVMMVPVTAHAAEAMGGPDLLAKAVDGVITLTGDVQLNSTMVIAENQSITLNLNGYSITADPSVYAIQNFGTFVLNGEGTIDSRGMMNGSSSQCIGTMIVNGGTIIAASSTGGAAINNYGASVIVNGGVFKTCTSETTDPAALMNKGSGTVVLNKGTFIGNALMSYPIINVSTGSITIEKDVEIIGRQGAVCVWDGSVVVNGATLTVNGDSAVTGHVVYTSGNGQVSLNGGNYTSNSTTGGSCGVYVNGGSVTINDGTFSGSVPSANAAEGTLTINNGTFEREIKAGNGTVSISGGTFEVEPDEEWIADGIEKIENADGSWTVKNPNAPVVSNSTGACHHSYEWDVYYDATVTTDGKMAYRCKYCGEVSQILPVSAYAKFLKETTKTIKAAGANTTVDVKTDIWMSFSKAVATAMQENPTVSVNVQFRYAGHVFTITIPAGYDLMSMMNEEGYAGFLYLATDPVLNLQMVR